MIPVPTAVPLKWFQFNTHHVDGSFQPTPSNKISWCCFLSSCCTYIFHCWWSRNPTNLQMSLCCDARVIMRAGLLFIYYFLLLFGFESVIDFASVTVNMNEQNFTVYCIEGGGMWSLLRVRINISWHDGQHPLDANANYLNWHYSSFVCLWKMKDGPRHRERSLG